MNIAEIIQLLITISIIVGIEVVLSFDNVAVLALIVNKNLPINERKKALRYGVVGAFLFRGLCLFFVSWIINNPDFGIIFKIVGGAYLLWLSYKGLTPQKDSIEEGEVSWADSVLKYLGIGIFWSTVIVVEIVDIVFSLDNLVAVVSLSDKIWIVIVGVSLGILAMRFVAGWFTMLMVKYSSLEKSAMIVIGLLGLKLIASGCFNYFSGFDNIKQIMTSHTFDFSFSGVMMIIFFLPILLKKLRA